MAIFFSTESGGRIFHHKHINKSQRRFVVQTIILLSIGVQTESNGLYVIIVIIITNFLNLHFEFVHQQT